MSNSSPAKNIIDAAIAGDEEARKLVEEAALKYGLIFSIDDSSAGPESGGEQNG